MLTAAALEELVVDACAVGSTVELDDFRADDVTVALAVVLVDVVDVVLGLGSSSSPSRYSLSS